MKRPSTTRPFGGSDVIPEDVATHKVFGVVGETVIDSFQGIMNDCQVAIAETTWGGHEDLVNEVGKLKYPELMTAALQCASTAREAVEFMGWLVNEFGYIDEGESISVCDKNEAWIFEICGTGATAENDTGCVWVAMRVPDGQITAHANQARIGVFPKDDPDNCIYSDNIEQFAIDHGLYDPNSGKPFSFYEVYGCNGVGDLRACEKRVWSIFRRAAPSLNLSVDYAQGVEGAELIPGRLRLIQAQLPTLRLLCAITTTGLNDLSEGSTPVRTVTRCAVVPCTGNSTAAICVERLISTQQTCFSIITRSRSDLRTPSEDWSGLAGTIPTRRVTLPFTLRRLCVPKSTNVGSINRFDMKTGWWTYNLVANYAYPRYKEMIPMIKAEQERLENYFTIYLLQSKRLPLRLQRQMKRLQ